MSVLTVLGSLGWVLTLFGVAMLLPVGIALAFGETGTVLTFVGSAALTGVFGVLLVVASRDLPRVGSRRRDGFFLTVLAWLIPVPFGALPLYLGGVLDGYADACLETLSGITTTGLTLIVDLGAVDHSFIFWRALLQWIGGFATIVLAISVLPSLGVGGMQIYRSELPQGLADGLQPRLTQTARAVASAYLVLSGTCLLLLAAAGVPWFDALCYTLSTLSTGGFHTANPPATAFAGVAAQLVVMVFMVVAALNFSLHWALLHARAGVYRRDPEFRFLLSAILIGLVLYLIAIEGGDRAGDMVAALFNIVAVLTTTGYLIGDGAQGPVSLTILFLILAVIGGSTGSTAGGLKAMRLLLLLKQGLREILRLAHPHGVISIKYGRFPVPGPVMQSLWGLFIAFVLGLIALTLAVAAVGVEFDVALLAVTAALTNTGPALVGTGSGSGLIADFPEAARWLLGLGMLLGRLELLTLLVLLTPLFWKP